MADHNLKNILESLLFVCDEPLSLARAASVLEKTEGEVKAGLEELADDFRRDERGIQLRRVAGGWRLYTHPGHAPYIEKLVISWDSRRLTQAALETLAIIAYKQPITKVSIGGIRGVNSDGAVSSLLAKGLVKEMGREKSPGSPILYGTNNLFLEKFGVDSLKDLPPLEEFEPDPMVRGEIEAGLVDEGEVTSEESGGEPIA